VAIGDFTSVVDPSKSKAIKNILTSILAIQLPTMLTVTPEWLQSIETLKDVPAEQLQWWIDNSKHHEIEEDAFLFKEGDAITGTHIIIKGRIKIFLKQKNGIRTIGFFETKDITGFLPFSRGAVSTGNAQAIEPLEVMTFPIERMKELIVGHYELTQALVQIMTSRVREFTTMQQQNEKMMALGKLSAGLATRVKQSGFSYCTRIQVVKETSSIAT
jgi:CRP-like cAMP-binding protein